jgi:pyrroline-5-carboxylate reductase
MKKKIGLIGLGHLGRWLITGFNKADYGLRFFVANRSNDKARKFAIRYGCFFTNRNQEAVDRSEIIILATRPDQINKALDCVEFTEEQIVVSVAAGVALKTLRPLVYPAKVVRALPVSCAVINKSPVIVYPKDRHVEDLFSLVGQVHRLVDEASFSPGTALVGAFYAWMFLLMDEVANWTIRQGIDQDTARKLVIETIEGACAMAADQTAMSFGDIWRNLATPGGISEHGAKIIAEGGGIRTWSEALEAINRRMMG